MKQCALCRSYAINHHQNGRDGSDPELCDVCYWRKRAASWLPRSYGGGTFDTRPLGLGPAATIRLHFSDAVEAESWFEHITDQLLEASKEKP